MSPFFCWYFTVAEAWKIKYIWPSNFFMMEDQNKQIPKTVPIPADGSIGLLALGDVGLRAWRAARGKRIKYTNTKGTEKKKKDGQKDS